MTVPILCHDRSFLITENLFWALKRIRDARHVRIIWVDVICINQQDIQERSAQVSQMVTIYNSAQTVFLAMGEASGKGAESVAALVKGFTSGPGSNVTLVSRSDPFQVYRHWYDLAELMSCPWFSRLWVVQEAGM